MLYLIFSIICSVTVGGIFKASRNCGTSITQIVAWNYAFAIMLCYVFFAPDAAAFSNAGNWYLYAPLAVLLPSIFILLARSIKYMGIVKTDAAQRLSLFIPVLAAWLLFDEAFNNFKLAGLAVGFPAILLILSKNREEESQSQKWIYPVMVLVGFGVIDVLFKKVASLKGTDYTTSLFVIFCAALCVAVLISLYEILFLKKRFRLINIAFGALIGIFNFGNILFYLKAHKEFSENPSTVFAAMNMGVIVLGSLVGIIIFREKLNGKNYLGILLALTAIVLITLSQIYKTA